MNNVVIEFDNGIMNTFYFGELSALTITPDYIEMRITDKNNLQEGICKYTYKSKIIGAQVYYDKQENQGTNTEN